MSFWDVRRSIVSAQLLTHLAAEHGIDLDACLQGTGVGHAALSDPETEISAAPIDGLTLRLAASYDNATHLHQRAPRGRP